MKITKIGQDYLIVDEQSELKYRNSKVHLIKLAFEYPTYEKINKVFDCFPMTKRFVVDNNIKFYNSVFKNIQKKFYVENLDNLNNIISFFRKNNKVLLNMNRVTNSVKEFILYDCLEDTLNNLEVILVDFKTFNENLYIFEKWNGNVIIEG